MTQLFYTFITTAGDTCIRKLKKLKNNQAYSTVYIEPQRSNEMRNLEAKEHPTLENPRGRLRNKTWVCPTGWRSTRQHLSLNPNAKSFIPCSITHAVSQRNKQQGN